MPWTTLTVGILGTEGISFSGNRRQFRIHLIRAIDQTLPRVIAPLLGRNVVDQAIAVSSGSAMFDSTVRPPVRPSGDGGRTRETGSVSAQQQAAVFPSAGRPSRV